MGGGARAGAVPLAGWRAGGGRGGRMELGKEEVVVGALGPAVPRWRAW